MRYYHYLKISFIYCIFFVILYFEGMPIGGVQISQLWKLPIIAYVMVWVVINYKRTFIFNKYAYGYGLIKLFNVGIVNTPIVALTDFMKFSTFPFFLDYCINKIRSPKKVLLILFYISQFVILSFIPFLFHIIKAPHIGTYADMTIKEIMEEAGKTSGLFLSSHGASAILALCLIIIIYIFQHQKMKKLKRVYFIFLIIIGVWALITTYARGGWAMFVVGMIILFFKMEKKYIIGGLCAGLIGIFGVLYLMETNETFYNRIMDKGSKGEVQKEVGSGRLAFAKNGLDFWMNSHNIQEYLTGQGYDKLTQYQKEKTGLKIYCHNGFVDALAQNGFIGFTLFIMHFYFVFLLIYRNRKDRNTRLVFSIFVMKVVFNLVQGGVNPYSDIIYVLTLCLFINGRIEQCYKKMLKRRTELPILSKH